MSTDVSEVHAASIINGLMTEAARTSETSVDIQFKTRQYIPEYSELHTRRCKNLKSHRYNTYQSWRQNTNHWVKRFMTLEGREWLCVKYLGTETITELKGYTAKWL
jgi:hypothetical protein